MRILVAGAGPTGLLAGAALAGRGHDVVAVDRDPGPPAAGGWQRRGVMQFGHAHGFRPQVGDVLDRLWPRAHRTWLCLGAEPRDGDGVPMGLASRRVTFERALRCTAADEPSLTLRHGHVDGLLEDGGRVVGARVDGRAVEADLVVDATGRAGRLAGGRTGTASVDHDCGIAYVNRTYRLRTGAAPGPTNMPIGWFAQLGGFLVLLFTHEHGHFSVVLVRRTADDRLKDLRHDAVFDAVARAVPGLADWTDPARARTTGPVAVGGALRNTYRPQRGLPGLVAVGDAVTTTAPTAGRGVAMSFLQVEALLGMLDAASGPDDAATVAGPFGAWCEREMLPWVLDHVRNDDDALRRWRGHDVDLAAPLPSDLVVAAAAADPSIAPLVGPYLGMQAPPSSLDAAVPAARAVYERGWRPPLSPGPGAADVAAIARDVLGRAAHEDRRSVTGCARH